MSWPGPPDDDRRSEPDPMAGPEEPSPWRPEPRGTPSVSDAAGAAPRRKGGSRTPVLVGGALGVVALGVAGWLAVSQGLILGLGGGGGAGSAVGSAPDLSDEPEDAWTYTYLPRTADSVSVSFQAEGDRLLILTYPGYSEGEMDGDHTLGAIDLRSGEELWKTPLEVGSHADADSHVEVSLSGVVDGAALVNLTSYNYDTAGDYQSTLHLIDISDGSERHRVDVEGRPASVGDSDALVLIGSDQVSRLDPNDPGGEPLWEATVRDAAGSGYVNDGYVHVGTPHGSEFLDLETGEAPAWFDGPDLGYSYRVVGGEIFRIESGQRGRYLEALDADGGVEWSQDADEFFTRETGDGKLVMFAAEKGRGESPATYSYLRRIDPKDGEELWDEELEADFDTVGSIVDEVFTLDMWEGDSSDLHDLDTGERVARLRDPVQRTGGKTFYSLADERLRALDTQGEELWSVRARGAESFIHTPGHLVTQDSVAGRLTRWE